ncbi:MAG: hypothetical protein Q4C77_07445 [Eubacteriales bacterium]|nr:hypothetical protein [Eubacteriales bacterium]
MIEQKEKFVIQDYGKKAGFASFLPGISGEKGIPIWCYYVNRGQCITSFGIQDKDHAIMEFYPAHQSYVLTKKMGFRTFIKADGKVIEPFACEKIPHTMYVGMNTLEISEMDEENGLKTEVVYFTLPGETAGALVRCVHIRNISSRSKNLEVLDGMPAVIPYGVTMNSMKEMGQTMKAWMEVLHPDSRVPFFKVRASTADSAEVKEVHGGNFGFAVDQEGMQLPVIVDTEQIFAYDTSFGQPVCLQESSLKDICNGRQTTENLVPCCFFAKEAETAPGEELVLYEIYGQAESREILEEFLSHVDGPEYFERKMQEAVSLTEKITDKIATKTGNAAFDQYCRQTFLDNVLRGGYPVILGKNTLFYLYSRKHGDIERDYNYFSMLPEFFSQGNGNFRDVNQNRRCDVQFAPYVEDKNIRTFYNCIQINGYNPLGIEKMTYRADVEGFQEVFTPGELYAYLKKTTENPEELEARFTDILEKAECGDATKFIEGYWTDHWTYNLDLLESYLTVYPEREETLLFGERIFTYLQAKEEILPRAKRYVKTANGIRQYHFLTANPKAEQTCLTDNNGTIVKSTLAEKLFLLSVVKTAALDAYGMGTEMEGGKPGWYDALNGLPGLLGSSMCETYETARNLEFLLRVLETYKRELKIPEELNKLAAKICSAAFREHPDKAEGEVLSYWNLVNDAKEAYWKATEEGISGNMAVLSWTEAAVIVKQLQAVVLQGIAKAVRMGGGISPAYFYYEVTDYTEDHEGIHPVEMKCHMLPYFLEGPVRHLKLEMETEEKRALCARVKESDLYDRKLKMYKVNAPLADSSFELGRCRAFTPGWLENESIWLHMEYKYLLEELKSGLYPEFLEDFHKAAIPFLSAETYGRSLYENSSFIASSANPNPKLHGKGFVARLSGSTAEFLQMWQIMMFGKRPFGMEDGELALEFQPLLPAYLLNGQDTVEAAFLGTIPVTYHLCGSGDFVPGNYRVASAEVKFADGTAEKTAGKITGEAAEKIRRGEASGISVYLTKE